MCSRVWLAVVSLLPAGPALAGDVGEIALVEDTGGDILQVVALGNTYLQRAACAFYQDHGDQYDALFVYTTASLNMLSRVQQGWATKSFAMGIGRDIYLDTQSRFCSGRLRHAVKMGDVGAFSDDPDAVYTGIFGFTLSGVELMGHEFGHQWLASVRFDPGDGLGPRCRLRGFLGNDTQPLNPDCEGWMNSDFNQHWSYYLNTGSVMYGNTIRDLGGGSFELSNPGTKYSELDQYLMGLRTPAEVGPLFLVDQGDLSPGSSSFPVPRGRTEVIQGDRVDFTVADVIRAEGPRVPALEPCHWKAAFLLVHPAGQPPTAAEIGRVDTYRRRWEEFYATATDQRGSFDTSLTGGGPGTAGCPAVPSPAQDAGVRDAAALDAAALDASLAPDAGPADSAQARDAEPHDAAPAPAADAGEDGVRTLKEADCDCTAAHPADSGGGGRGLALVLLLLAARPGRRNRRR